ncbi:MAG: (deoxy)nucleoside triphosphate pyrophosphohydrolase [Erysipelotrichaceae bacterium]
MKTIKVVAAIIKKDNQILIAQRLKGDFEGLWEFPGGKIEANESSQAALKREIKEEMELNIEVGKQLISVHHTYEKFILNMKCFLCSLVDTNIILHDHKAIKWINIDIDIDSIRWVPADIKVMKAIQKEFNHS